MHEFQLEAHPVMNIARSQTRCQTAASIKPGTPFSFRVNIPTGGIPGDRPGWAGHIAVHENIATRRVTLPGNT